MCKSACCGYKLTKKKRSIQSAGFLYGRPKAFYPTFPPAPHPQESVAPPSPLGSMGGDTLAYRGGGGRTQF
jgi:hypothetical protein